MVTTISPTSSPTSSTGAARAAVFVMFLSLTDPVVPFAPEGDDRGSAWDASPTNGTAPDRTEEQS